MGTGSVGPSPISPLSPTTLPKDPPQRIYPLWPSNPSDLSATSDDIHRGGAAEAPASAATIHGSGQKKAGRNEVRPARIWGQGSYWYLMTSLPPWTWTLTKDSAGVMLR